MDLDRNELSKKISRLIQSKKEGKTWDFKAKWYMKSEISELVKDIICMANNPTPDDAYIIIGIDEKTKKPLGSYCLEKDSSRKSEENLISSLSSEGVKWANNNIPEVRLETVRPVDCDFEVDVIIIKSTSRVPYYLTKVYKTGQKETGKIEPNTIYLRRGSRNSKAGPEVAIFPEIEALWKKRFGLNLSIKERFDLLLSNKEDWDIFKLRSKKVTYIISKSCPDFTIRMSKCDSLPGPEKKPASPSQVRVVPPLTPYLPPYTLGINYFPPKPIKCMSKSPLESCGRVGIFFRELELGWSYFDVLRLTDGGRGHIILGSVATFLRPRYDSISSRFAYFYLFKEDDFYRINSLLRHFQQLEISRFYSKKDKEEIEENLEFGDSLFNRHVVCFENMEEKEEFDNHLYKKYGDIGYFVKEQEKLCKICFFYDNVPQNVNKDSLTQAFESFMKQSEIVKNSEIYEDFKDKEKKEFYIDNIILNLYIVKYFYKWKKDKG